MPTNMPKINRIMNLVEGLGDDELDVLIREVWQHLQTEQQIEFLGTLSYDDLEEGHYRRERNEREKISDQEDSVPPNVGR